jgi:hypothetical protein
VPGYVTQRRIFHRFFRSLAREKNLPAQQYISQENAWLFGAQRYERWSLGA